ncbi:MAG: FecR domain-containing protein [Leptolyngbya sp. SIO1D8]|nr:FecR domain-containing protein [Leptolyngbya sp. SIO1D8]
MRHRYRRHWRICLRASLLLLGTLLAFGLQSLLGAPLHAQSVTQARITEILEGNQVYIQDRQAQVNSVAQQQQRVRTGTSRAALSFNTGAVARLAYNSSLTVGQCAQLRQGTILVNGALNSCTGSSVAGVRGTLYTLTIGQGGVETLRVFEGTVEISHQPNEEAPVPEPPQETEVPALWGRRLNHHEAAEIAPEAAVVVGEGQSLIYDPVLRQGRIQQLTAEDFERLLRGPLVADFTIELPGIRDLRDAFERLFPDTVFPELSLPTPVIPTPALPTPSVPLPSLF